MNHSQVPKLEYTFEHAINPYANQLKEEMERWVDESIDLSDTTKFKVKQGVFGHLAARMFPQANYQQLISIGRMVFWGFAKDDDYITPEKLDEELMITVAILEGNTFYPSNTLFGQLTLLREELLQYLPLTLQKRFISSVIHYLDGVNKEMPYKLSSTNFPSLEEYMEIRERTAGQLMCIDLIEPVLDLYIPEDIINNEEVQRLRILCGRLIGWCNDFHSVERERGKEVLNLLLVIENEFGFTPEQAYQYALHQVHNPELEEFIYLQTLLGSYSDYLKTYADALALMVSGHFQWYSDSLRYKPSSKL